MTFEELVSQHKVLTKIIKTIQGIPVLRLLFDLVQQSVATCSIYKTKPSAKVKK